MSDLLEYSRPFRTPLPLPDPGSATPALPEPDHDDPFSPALAKPAEALDHDDPFSPALTATAQAPDHDDPFSPALAGTRLEDVAPVPQPPPPVAIAGSRAPRQRFGSFAPSGGVPGQEQLPVMRPGFGDFLASAGSDYSQAETPIPLPDVSARPVAPPTVITNAPVGATITAPTTWLDRVKNFMVGATTNATEANVASDTSGLTETGPALMEEARRRGLTTPPQARPSAITNAPVGSTVTSPYLDLRLPPHEGPGIVMAPMPGAQPGLGTQLAQGVETTAQMPYAVGTQMIVRQRLAMDAIDAGQPIDPNDDTMGYQAMSPEQRAQARAQLAQGLDENLTTLRGSQQYIEALPLDPNYEAYLKGQIPFSQAPFSIAQAGVVPSIPPILGMMGASALGGPSVLARSVLGTVAGAATTGPQAAVDQVFAQMRAEGVDPDDTGARRAWINANGQRIMDTYGTEMFNSVVQNAAQMGPFEAARYLPVPAGLRLATGVGLGAGTGGVVGPEAQAAITGREQTPQEKTIGGVTGALFGAAGGVGGHAPPRVAPMPRMTLPERPPLPLQEPVPRETLPVRPADRPAPPAVPPVVAPEPAPIPAVPEVPRAPEPAVVPPPAEPAVVAGARPAEPVPPPPEPARAVAPGERPVEPPAAPVEPARPVEPVRPVETAAAPVEPARPIEPERPIEPVRPTEPVAASVEPTRPAEPPAAPVRPSESVRTEPEQTAPDSGAPHPASIAGRIDTLEAVGNARRTEAQTSELMELYRRRAEHEQPSEATNAKEVEVDQINARIGTLEQQIARADARKGGEIAPTKAQIARREEVNSLYRERQQLQEELASERRADTERMRRATRAPPEAVADIGQTRNEPAPPRSRAEEPATRAVAEPEVKVVETPEPAPRRAAETVHETVGEPTEREELITQRSAVHEQAFRDAGVEPDRAVNLKPERQVAILSSLLKDRYGFRDVRELRGAHARETIDNMLNAYRNLQSTAHVFGMRPEDMSLRGRIALGFGPRNNRYLGSYNPATRTISAAGMSNSFLHEYAHAVDHMLVEHLRRGNPTRDFASEATTERGFGGAAGLNTDTAQAFSRVLNAMFTGDASLAGRMLELQMRADEHLPNGKLTPRAERARQEIADLRTQNASQFVENAVTFGGPKDASYWARPTELLARAWESLGAKLLDDAGLSRAFITKSDRAMLSEATDRFRLAYPKETDRNLIHAELNNLVAAMRRDQIIGDGTPGSAHPTSPPGDYDIVDPRRWHKTQPLEPAGKRIRNVATSMMGDFNLLGRALTEPRAVLDEMRMSPNIPQAGPRPTIRQSASRSLDFARPLMTTMGGYGQIITARQGPAARPMFQRVMDIIDPRPGHDPGAAGQRETYGNAERREGNSRLNQLARVFRDEDVLTRAGRDADFNAALRLEMTGHGTPDSAPEVVRTAAELRRYQNDLWHYMHDRGINVGTAAEPYMQRVMRTDLVERHGQAQFTKDGIEVYGAQFDEAMAKATTPGEKQIQRNALGGEIQLSARDVSALSDSQLRQAYATGKADSLWAALTAGKGEMHAMPGISTGFTEHRVLGAEADVHFAKYYEPNVLEAATQYTHQAVRRAEAKPRLDEIEPLYKKAALAGASKGDIELLRGIVDNTMGVTQRNPLPKPIRTVGNWANTLAMMSMMARAPFASFTEPTMAFQRTRDVGASLRVFRSFVDQVMQNSDALRHRQIAESFGSILDGQFESTLNHRFGGPTEGMPGRLLNRSYALSGLNWLTNHQRVAATAGAEVFLRHLVNDAVKGEGYGQRNAVQRLREFGMADAEHQNIYDWWQRGTRQEALFAEDMLDSREGTMIGRAISEVTRQIIADPTNIDKPMMAFNPTARMAYGLTAFNYATARNWQGRAWNEIKSAHGFADTARTALGNLAFSAPPIVAGIAFSVIRDSLMGTPVRPDDNRDHTTDTLMRGASRSGVFGKWDTMVQSMWSFKYHHDVSHALVGPANSYWMDALRPMVDFVTGSNSDATNSRERAVVRGVQMALVPVLMLGAALLPETGPLVAAGTMFGTSPRTQSAITDAVAGAPDTKGGRRSASAPPRPVKPPRPPKPGS